MFSDLCISRSRTSLNGYEKLRLPFHAIRTTQLVSSFIVFVIMSFFMYHVNDGGYTVPWTFKVLMAVSVLTVTILALTITLHLTNGLNPYLNLTFNTTIFCIWTMGFGMLSWYMYGTLRHSCSVATWHDSRGIMVCQIYKTLFTFALLGVVSTAAALALDIIITRSNTSTRHFALSQLNPLPHDRKRSPATTGPYTDIGDQAYSRENLTEGVDAFEVPRGYAEGGRGYTEARRDGERDTEGYVVPEQQFDYETGYYGGHAERVFGAK